MLHKVILTLLKTWTGSVHTISNHSYNHVMTILCVIFMILTDLKHSCIAEYITNKQSITSSKLYYPSSGWFFTPNWQRVFQSLSDRLIKLNLYTIMMINDNVLHWYMIMSRPKVRPYYGKCKFGGNIRYCTRVFIGESNIWRICV